MHVKWDRPTGNIHGKTGAGWIIGKCVDTCKAGTGRQVTYMAELGLVSSLGLLWSGVQSSPDEDR